MAMFKDMLELGYTKQFIEHTRQALEGKRRLTPLRRQWDKLTLLAFCFLDT